MVGQAVEQRAGQAFCPKGFRPFVEWQIAGNQRGTALIAVGDQLEQQLSPRFCSAAQSPIRQ